MLDLQEASSIYSVKQWLTVLLIGAQPHAEGFLMMTSRHPPSSEK